MSFFGFFKKNKKDDVKLSERKQNALQDAAVAATFAEAGEHDTARSMIDKSKGKNTILVIGQEDSFSEKLASYAIDMAKRLDYEIMAINITDASLSKEAIAEFEKKCADNCTSLKDKAAGAGIQLSHLMEVGQQDEVVEKIHSEYPGMRYVLTEPDPEVARKAKDEVAIPVFDLGSFQRAVA